MAERLNAAALKAVVPATVPWVRIPLSPPFRNLFFRMPIHKGLHGAKFVVSLFLIVLFAYVIVYADTFFTGDEVTVINPIFTEASTNDLASINVNTIIVND